MSELEILIDAGLISDIALKILHIRNIQVFNDRIREFLEVYDEAEIHTFDNTAIANIIEQDLLLSLSMRNMLVGLDGNFKRNMMVAESHLLYNRSLKLPHNQGHQ